MATLWRWIRSLEIYILSLWLPFRGHCLPSAWLWHPLGSIPGAPSGPTLCTLGFAWLSLGGLGAAFVHFGVHLTPFGVPLGHFVAPGTAQGYNLIFYRRNGFSIPSDGAIPPQPAHKKWPHWIHPWGFPQIPRDTRTKEKSPGAPQGSHSAATADFGTPLLHAPGPEMTVVYTNFAKIETYTIHLYVNIHTST